MRLLALLILPLLVTGCLASPSAPEGVDPGAADSSAGRVGESRTVASVSNGTITGVGAGATAGNAFLCCVSAHQQGENLIGTFHLEENITRILVELAWADPAFDLDMLVAAPDYAFFLPPEFDPSGPRFRDNRGFSVYEGSGTITQPDGRVLIDITDPEALNLTGEWFWEVRSKTAVQVPFTVTVILEYGHDQDEAAPRER